MDSSDQTPSQLSLSRIPSGAGSSRLCMIGLVGVQAQPMDTFKILDALNTIDSPGLTSREGTKMVAAAFHSS